MGRAQPCCPPTCVRDNYRPDFASLASDRPKSILSESELTIRIIEVRVSFVHGRMLDEAVRPSALSAKALYLGAISSAQYVLQVVQRAMQCQIHENSHRSILDAHISQLTEPSQVRR